MSHVDAMVRRGHQRDDKLVQEFIDHWVALSGAAWLALGGMDDVRRAVVRALDTLAPARVSGEPRRVVAWDTPELASMRLPALFEDLGCEYVPWTVEPTVATRGPGLGGLRLDASADFIARLRGLAASSDLGITTCFLAVAQTGTIALLVTSGAGRLPSLLPTAHLALVRPSQIVRSIPDGLRLLADHVAQHCALPSAVNLISGPSRSADIEGDLAVGVHGPQRAGVIVGEW